MSGNRGLVDTAVHTLDYLRLGPYKLILSMLAPLLVASNCNLAILQSSESREEDRTAAGVDDEDDTGEAWTSTSGRR